MDFLTKAWLKISNKIKYQKFKDNLNLKKRLNKYDTKIRHEIEKISEIIQKKNQLNFMHSGHLGDLIYSLATVKHMSKTHKCNFFINANKKIDVNYFNHPSGSVLINSRTANLLLPLLKKQKYLNKVEIYDAEKIDINLDLYRDIPINDNFHSMRWYMHLLGENLNMSEPFLDVDPHPKIFNKIIIMRSPRYRNQFINYHFMKDVKDIVCIGLESEYREIKNYIPNLEFFNCKDFLEMASIIKSSRFFIGNLCFAYSVAEALKVPRILETCPDFPVVFPCGENAFDFYHQIHFEKIFKKLNDI